MWIRRSLCLLAICFAQTVFAQAQEYQVTVKNGGADGEVEVKCEACSEKIVREKKSMRRDDKEEATVHGPDGQRLTWTHIRSDNGAERTGGGTYYPAETVLVLSAD